MKRAKLTLTRYYRTDAGKPEPADHDMIIGELLIVAPDGKASQFSSGELAWRQNKRNVSCVPAGEYAIKEETESRFVPTYMDDYGHEFVLELVGVPGRSQILLHTGNFAKDIQGCILVGDGVKLHPKPIGVVSSKKGYRRFMAEYLRLRRRDQHPTHLKIIGKEKA